MLTSLVSVLVSLAFVIGNSAKSGFESIIFLFVVHPFDVGDRVLVRLEAEKENLIVHKMHLLTTVFRK